MPHLYTKEQKVIVKHWSNEQNQAFYTVRGVISNNDYLLTPELEFAEQMIEKSFTPRAFPY